ncbi:hypothetical protein WMF11_22435 [Sorangium sp. So ce295]|uniref:hypothetical protein n=1 Tax=Sorangium sp. So ce295 TaxID=3133295 RepID=UPI003F614959
MTRWEYLYGGAADLGKHLGVDKTMDAVLKAAGLAGWELVQVKEFGDGSWHCFFKRPLQEPWP